LKKFNNRHNRYLKGKDGGGWVSRSNVTVTMIIFNDYVLCVKRGESVSETGKWCMPCGYLDYNETLEEGAFREIYEETSLYLLGKVPIKLTEINDIPGTGRKQNIHFHYLIISPEMYQVNPLMVDPGEVTDIKWIHKRDIKDYDFAFGHDVRIGYYFDNNYF
jgi:8-oxo-dGTP pyrophosphatase MutT (NUDIX family)